MATENDEERKNRENERYARLMDTSRGNGGFAELGAGTTGPRTYAQIRRDDERQKNAQAQNGDGQGFLSVPPEDLPSGDLATLSGNSGRAPTLNSPERSRANEMLLDTFNEHNHALNDYADGRYTWADDFLAASSAEILTNKEQPLSEHSGATMSGRDIDGAAKVASLLAGKSNQELAAQINTSLDRLNETAATRYNQTNNAAFIETQQTINQAKEMVASAENKYHTSMQKASSREIETIDATKDKHHQEQLELRTEKEQALSGFADEKKGAIRSLNIQTLRQDIDRQQGVLRAQVEAGTLTAAAYSEAFTAKEQEFKDVSAAIRNGVEIDIVNDGALHPKDKERHLAELQKIEAKFQEKRGNIETEFGVKQDELAERHKVELERVKEQAAQAKQLAEQEAAKKYRGDLLKTLEAGRGATHDLNIAEISSQIETEKKGANNPDTIKKLEYSLQEHQALKSNDTSHPMDMGQLLDESSQYAAKVERGYEARQDRRAETLNEFVGNLRNNVIATYDKREAEAREKLVGEPLDEALEKIQIEKNQQLIKLDQIGSNDKLKEQIAFIEQRIDKLDPPLSNDALIAVRNKMFESALTSNGNEQAFAGNFLGDNSPLGTEKPLNTVSIKGLGLAPVKLNELTNDPSQIMKIKLAKNERGEEIIKLTMDGQPEPVIITGKKARDAHLNGLDLNGISPTRTTELVIDNNAGFNADTKPMMVFNSEGKNIRASVTGDVILGSIATNNERRAETYAAFQPVGSNEQLTEHLAERSMGARILAHKEMRGKALALGRQLDADGNGQISKSEFAALDMNFDGKLDNSEIPKAARQKIAMLMGDGNDDVISKLRDMNSGQQVQINIADLGNVNVPSTQIAGNNRGSQNRGS